MTIETKNLGQLFKEAREKYNYPLSNGREKSGILRVGTAKCNDCKQGYQWCYRYIDKDGRRRTISRVDLLTLKKVVISRGLEWRIYDEKQAVKTAKQANVELHQIL